MNKMKLSTILTRVGLFLLIIQVGVFIFVKQRYNKLERENNKVENKIDNIINDNNLLKIKLTTMQNQNRVRKLVIKYASDFKAFQPKQVIEKENI